MNATREIQHLTIQEVFSVLAGRKDGLTEDEVHERLLEVGKNTFEVRDRWKWIRSLIKQLTNFFTILLNISAAICFVADHIQPGESMNILGWALLGVSLLNAMFSFIQEYRAEKAMEALKKFLPPQVLLRRQGKNIKILAEEIVPGDLLIISEGDRIPADARLINSEDIVVNNAPLTGEAKPLTLTSDPSEKRLTESENIAFAGCSVIKGTGRGSRLCHRPADRIRQNRPSFSGHQTSPLAPGEGNRTYGSHFDRYRHTYGVFLFFLRGLDRQTAVGQPGFHDGNHCRQCP